MYTVRRETKQPVTILSMATVHSFDEKVERNSDKAIESFVCFPINFYIYKIVVIFINPNIQID